MSALAFWTLLALAHANDAPAPPAPGADPAASTAILVEGDRRADATDAMATSAAVTVIEVDERLPASSDVSTVVDSVSGTTVQRLGGLGDWSGVSIRGSTLRQVQVVLDGVPLNPDGASAVNLSELPLFAFERVEVFRGNAPPELSASPIGGVVHLRTGDGRLGTTASVSHGSLDTSRVTAMTRHGEPDWRVPVDVLAVADLFATRGDFSYYSDNGTEYARFDDRIPTRENNDKRQLNTHLRLRLGPSDTRVTLLQAWLSRDEGLPGHANNPTEQVSLHTGRSLTSASLDLQRGMSRVQGRTWVLLRGDTYDDRFGEVGTGTQHNEDAFGSLGATVHWQQALGSHVVSGLTLTGRQDRFSTTDLLQDEVSEASRRLAFTPALDADLRLWRDRITVSPVLQGQFLDNRALGDVPFEDIPVSPEASDTLFAATPRLGMLVRPVPVLALKANVGRYLRPPDFTELFGDRGAIMGNTDLKPERGVQWDVGARAVAPDAWSVQGSLEVGHFWNSVEDLIVMIQNSQRTSVPINLDRGWIQGVEAAVTLQASFLEAQSNLTRTTSVNLSTERQSANNQLPRVPTWELYQRTALAWRDHLRLGHTWSYTDGNYWDRTNYYRSAPRAFHGAFVRLSPGGAWPSIEVDGLNLTDRIVEVVPRNPLNPDDGARVVQPTTDFVGYPLAGRTVLVTLRWERLSPSPSSRQAP